MLPIPAVVLAGDPPGATFAILPLGDACLKGLSGLLPPIVARAGDWGLSGY